MHRVLRGNDDSGFTLVEVLVSMVIISGVLLTLIFVQTASLRTAVQAKQRVQATALANRTMETVRALPYAELLNGMSATDVATAEPYISAGRFRPTFDPSINEVLVTSNVAALAPIRPHVQPAVRVGTQDYRVKTYVTAAGASPATDGVMVSVVVEWASSVTGHQTKHVLVRSRAFNPAGCSGTTVRAFSGPCQTYLYGQAGSTGGSIQVSPGTGRPTLLSGDPDLTSAAGLTFPGVSAVAQAEQVISGTSTLTTASTTLTRPSGTTSTGGVRMTSTASTDPATGVTTSGPALVSQPSSTDVSVSGALGQLRVDPGTGSGSGISVPVASASSGCLSPTDAQTSTSQICSSGRSSGATMSVSLDLGPVGGRNLPLSSLSAVTPPSGDSQRGWTGRYTAGVVDHCTGAPPAGCMAAGAKRALDDALVGSHPATSAGDVRTPIFAGYMARVTAYTDETVSEANAPTVRFTSGKTGTLSYWNGTAYSPPVSLAGVTSPFSVSLGTAETAYKPSGLPSGPTAFTIRTTGTLQVEPAARVQEGVAPCTADRCVYSATSGTVTIDVRYEVLAFDGVLLEDFQVSTDLGASLAQTAYRGAP